MSSVLVLNGPNLNLLGSRRPEVYGHATLADVERLCRAAATEIGWDVDFRQTNHEGVLLDWIHESAGFVGVVLNAGAYTHTSVALHDAIEAVEAPVIEVHISNVHWREAFRHHSYVSAAAAGIVVGFGVDGYPLAIAGLRRLVDRPSG